MGASDLTELTLLLAKDKSLSGDEAEAAASQFAEGRGTLEEREAFLLALHNKGETPVEVAAFAKLFRDLARDPELGEDALGAIDLVGTGGDKSGTANISTMAALLVASTGTPVVKHGNRSITSKCGSADLVAALSFPLDADNATLRKTLEANSFTFLFAPKFHPAFAHVADVRKSLAAKGKRTVFNILGPLLNPARMPYLLMGVYAEHWVEPLAEVLTALGLKRALVVHGKPLAGGPLDELSCAGETLVAGAGELVGLKETWRPEQFGLQACELEALQGGDLDRNVAILDELAESKASRGLIDTVAFNAGVALYLAEKANSPEAGIAAAQNQLEGGAFDRWLKRFLRQLS